MIVINVIPAEWAKDTSLDDVSLIDDKEAFHDMNTKSSQFWKVKGYENDSKDKVSRAWSSKR